MGRRITKLAVTSPNSRGTILDLHVRMASFHFDGFVVLFPCTHGNSRHGLRSLDMVRDKFETLFHCPSIVKAGESGPNYS